MIGKYWTKHRSQGRNEKNLKYPLDILVRKIYEGLTNEEKRGDRIKPFWG